MGQYVIKMPDIGEGIAEVELVHWYVKPGDTVAEEQILADVMTDKANVEIPSNVSGKVISISGKPGDVLAVGSEIIRIEVEGKGNVTDSSSPPLQRNVADSSSPPLQRSDGRGSNSVTEAPAAKVEAKPAPKPELKPAPALRSVPPPPPFAEIGFPPTRGRQDDPDRPLAAPAVRRRAKELGIDLAHVQGSGPEGRVTQDDLEA